MTNRLRSLLHVPAASSGSLDIAATAADALIVDLTGDGGHPAADRGPVRDAIAAAGGRLRVFVRVNGVASGRLAEDLAAVLPARPFGVMLSGVAGPADVEQLGARLRVSEAELGRPDGETRIIPVLGAPAGVLALAGRPWPAGRIAAYAWEPPMPGWRVRPPSRGRPADVTRLTRSLTVLAASHAGVPAIDPPADTDEADEAFRRACLAALREGLGGKVARNEAQAGIVNAVFSGEDAARA
ncbi:aldolase/citrate lyase family protein [Pseudochelatococcus sp. B33]